MISFAHTEKGKTMSKYIDKDKVLEYIIFGVVGKDITCGELTRAIESLPTIEIVHCKDCKWCGVQNEPEGTCYYWCRNIGVGFAVDEWNYCCWGERADMRGNDK